MQLSDLVAAMEAIAPTRYAELWDNVGLLVGDPRQPVAKVLLTIDYTPLVADEGRREGCDAVIAYHPPIFEALKRVTSPSPVFDAIRRGVGIYSPHTALDVADGGTNDMLADALGLAERSPLRPATAKANQYKLIVFVPEDAADAVASAIFAAGAGRIGAYSSCGFRSAGTGTFLGDESTNPAIGEKGSLQRVPELRLETVLPIDRVAAVVEALRHVHPYEEPAFDLVQLAAEPEGKGLGRIGDLARPTERHDLFARIKSALGTGYLLIAGPTAGPVTRVACGAGACGDMFNDALNQKAELYLTGEMRHHDALKAAHAGMTVVCTMHSNSERAVLKRLARQLADKLPALAIHISREDRDPFALQ